MTNERENVQIRANQRVVKKLGDWTTARRFDVRASRGIVVLDLLLPDLDPSAVGHEQLHGRVVDVDGLRRVGRGRIKDWTGTAAPGGRTIKLVGEMRNGEVRVHRGGVALLSLLASRETRRQLREAHRAGRLSPAA